jgi:probable HAF family extracellular repeat protein
VAILLGAGVLFLAGFLVSERERVADLVHALRTGYWFEWMPEGVIPGRNGTNLLNDAGVVAVEIVREWPFDMQAGTWCPAETALRPLGTLAVRGQCSQPYAMNAHGWVVGRFWEPEQFVGGAVFADAFLWTPQAGMTELPDLAQGPYIAAADINARGEIVGSATGTSGEMRAFAWDIGSGMRDLGALSEDGESLAVAINDHGHIVGNARDAQDVDCPVLWKPGAGMRSLGAFPGAANSYAEDINNRGEVLVLVEIAGSAPAAMTKRPVLWTEARGYEDLPIPSGQEWFGGSINDRGEVLLSAKGGCFLVLGGAVKELPGPRKGVDTRYFALNNRGWLAGTVELEKESGKPFPRRGIVARPR